MLTLRITTAHGELTIDAKRLVIVDIPKAVLELERLKDGNWRLIVSKELAQTMGLEVRER